MYQHLKKPSQMEETKAVFHVFVEGVKPMWEDANFQDGGRIVLRVQKGHFSNLYWEHLLLAMLGEQFTDENEVLGLIL
jgi:translation initiation factor 4E